MNKKQYATPQTNVVEMQNEDMIASSRWNSRERPQKSSQNMLRSFYLNTDYTDYTDFTDSY